MTYWERPTNTPGVVMWGSAGAAAASPVLILPDGCLDVIWDGRRAFVAGPDTAARWHVGRPAARYVALRFAAGSGAVVLDVGADELRDRTPGVGEVLGSAAERMLVSGIEEDAEGALQRWLDQRLRPRPLPPLGFQIEALSAAGVPVPDLAGRVGFSERQLRRRCQTLFGYGPRRLGRVLRLNRALDAARSGAPWSTVAAECRYADQAHLAREVRDLTGLTPTRLLITLSGR